jgi:hypothetical protein
MTASVRYATTRPLSGEQRAALREFVAQEVDGYEWWAGPLALADDPERPGHLTGTTQLFVLLPEPAVDSFMASTDLDRIVRALESASARFHLGWKLVVEDVPAGEIADGKRNADVDEAIQALLDLCERMGVRPEELDREAILEDNPGR